MLLKANRNKQQNQRNGTSVHRGPQTVFMKNLQSDTRLAPLETKEAWDAHRSHGSGVPLSPFFLILYSFFKICGSFWNLSHSPNSYIFLLVYLAVYSPSQPFQIYLALQSDTCDPFPTVGGVPKHLGLLQRCPPHTVSWRETHGHPTHSPCPVLPDK
jgi:hypothetical protein